MRRRTLFVSLIIVMIMLLGLCIAGCKPGYKEVWKPIKPYNYEWDETNGDLDTIIARVNSDCIEEKRAERINIDEDNKALVEAGKEPKPNEADAGYLLDQIADDGSFKNIPYDLDTKAYWPPLNHLKQMLYLQVAYNDAEGEYYHDERIKSAVTRTMNYWVEKNYVCEWNWWFNEVGVGMYLPNIILFGVEGLSDSDKATMLSRIEKTLLHTKPQRFNLYERDSNESGGNLTDQALSTLKFCLAKGDGNTIMWVTKQIENEMRPFPPYKGPNYHRWDAEGAKEDYSFQQHDQLIYIGGYGEVFMDGVNKYMRYTMNTQFQLSSKALNFYAELVANGFQFATRNGYRDISASGRGIARQNGLKGIFNNVKRTVDLLLKYNAEAEGANLKAENVEALERIKAERFGESDKGAGGHRYFYESDYNVYNGDKYMATVRHASDRTRIFEYLNGENPLGYYMGYGATFYYVDGDEYFNALPTYNWNKIPGTTTRQNKVPTMNQDFSYSTYGDNKYVGGVSNGKVGMSAFRSKAKGVGARKAYFMFEDGVVCLSSDISTVLPNDVVTNINQTLLKGDVKIGQGGNITTLTGNDFSGKADFIYHNKISYITDEEVSLITEKGKKGNWKTIDERGKDRPIANDMFTLDINHGKRPLGKNVAYTVLMNTTPEATADYVVNPTLKVVANTKNVQAVYDSKNDVLQAVFHKGGKIELHDGRVLKLNKGACVILEEVDGKPVLTIASTDYREHDVNVSISGKTYALKISKAPLIKEL